MIRNVVVSITGFFLAIFISEIVLQILDHPSRPVSGWKNCRAKHPEECNSIWTTTGGTFRAFKYGEVYGKKRRCTFKSWSNRWINKRACICDCVKIFLFLDIEITTSVDSFDPLQIGSITVLVCFMSHLNVGDRINFIN